MTKSKGVGRGVGSGGHRPGSGRPKKVGAAVIEARKRMDKPAAVKANPKKLDRPAQKPVEVQAPAPAPSVDPVGSIDPMEPDPKTAAELEGMALATLRQIMRASPQDSPRVSAAKEVLVRAQAEREALVGGKKAQRQAKAEERLSDGGRFTPMAPPGSGRHIQ